MPSALIVNVVEQSEVQIFAALLLQLSLNSFCSSFYHTFDQTTIIEFEHHPSGLFCSFGLNETTLIWNSQEKFHNMTFANSDITPENLRLKLLAILN